MRTQTLVFGFSLSLVMAGSAFADTITLANGKEYEGKVVADKPGFLKLVLPKAELIVAEAEVRSVVAAPALDELYQSRLKETPATAEGQKSLALWCQQKGMSREARDAFAKALTLDPECIVARQALGYRKVDGIWMSAEDRVAVTEAPKVAPAAREAAPTAREVSDTIEGETTGWMPDHKALVVEAKEKGLIDTKARYVRIGIPMVTLELKPTMAQLVSMRTITVAGSGLFGTGTPVIVEAPIVELTSVRTSAQVAGYSR